MSLGNRYSQHSFAQIPSTNQARSKFDRSFPAKDTLDFDYLNPIFFDEMLPGDTANLSVKHFCRLATQVTPVLDNMMLDFFFFFVPSRLLWDNFEKFMGAQDNPGDSTDFLVPQLVAPGAGGFTVGSIFDKFGLPTGVSGVKPMALPFRAYNLIWNEWFRDQNLQNSLPVPRGNGPDALATYSLKKRAKPHDYFTSSLPWPQKGSAVTIPMSGTAPVAASGQTINTMIGTMKRYVLATDTLRTSGALTGTTAITFPVNWSDNPPGTGNQAGDNIRPTIPAGQLVSVTGTADLSSVGTTVNIFRQAMLMQSLLELDARGGTRYTEILRAHWNVISPDFRLQRPEFLSGAQTRLQQHPVAQTSETGTTAQANLAAFTTASERGNAIGFTKSFVEHGYVLGFMQARGDVSYQQGMNRMWMRQTRWDFFWPKLQELGEQSVFRGELYSTGTSADFETWGYQERNAEYRYRPAEIRGQFRSTYTESLDVWHLAQEFGGPPLLNSAFIEANTPIERSLSVAEGYPHLLCDFWFDYKHARQIMTYGVPATLGRF